MGKNILTFIFSIFAIMIFAQEASFTMEVSNDTVLSGNYFIVKYKISNIEGEFTAPDFSDFELTGGPMSNSMFTMVNGKTSRESSYTYYLRPIKNGKSTIGKAKLIIGDEILYTDEIDIMILDNPENIRVQPRLKDDGSTFFIDSGNSMFEAVPEDKEAQKRKKLNIRKL